MRHKRNKRFLIVLCRLFAVFAFIVFVCCQLQPITFVIGVEFVQSNETTLKIYVTDSYVVLSNKTQSEYETEFAKTFAQIKRQFNYDLIEIYINSSGGIVKKAVALGNILSEQKEYKKIIINGRCYSAAVNIIAYSLPDEIQMTAHSEILFHQRRNKAGDLLGNNKQEIEWIARLTNKTIAETKLWFDNETRMRFAQAKDVGLLGKKIYTNRPQRLYGE